MNRTIKKLLISLILLVSVMNGINASAQCVQIDSFITSNVTCNGFANGSATIYLSGTNAPFGALLQRFTGTGFIIVDVAFNNFSGVITFNNIPPNINYFIRIADSDTTCPAILTNFFNITQPPVLNLVINSVTDVFGCATSATGSITVSGSGGTPPYQFSIGGGPFQASGTFGSLASGTYNIVIQDANGCTRNQNVTVSAPVPIALSVTNQVDNGCIGVAEGSFEVLVVGGVGPYQYSLNGGAFSAGNFFSGLAAGSYTVVVRDAQNCNDSITATISEPTDGVVVQLVSITPVSCFGAADATVQVSATDGTAPYSFSINGGAFAPSTTFSNLGPGDYTVVGMDDSGCKDTITFSVSEPSALEVSISSFVDVLCFTDVTGSATATATGGRRPYQFSLNGNPFQNDSVFSGLSGGNYMIVVRDSSGCLDSVSFVVNPVAALVVSVDSVGDVPCFGENSGTVYLSGTGGTPPYEFSFDGSPFSAANTYGGLAAGNYSFIIRDANNCLDSGQTAVAQPATALAISLDSSTNVICNGAADGGISVSASGGTGPYLFAINGGSFGAAGVFNNLASGTYILRARDANFCTDTVSVVISQPDPIDLLVAITSDVQCFGDVNGSVTFTATGGTRPYEYAIGSGAYVADSVFSGLSGGMYTGKLRDANGCEDSLSFTINPALPLDIVIDSFANVRCNGTSDGLIRVEASGGTSPYTYSINGSGFAPANSFANLAAGDYSIIVRDANNCEDSVFATIQEPTSLPDISVDSTVGVSCFGGSDGVIHVSANGGTAPYEFAIGNGSFSNLSSFIGLTNDTFILRVRDANGCIDSIATNPGGPAQGLVISADSVANVQCNGFPTGYIAVSSTGGSPGYLYSINGSVFNTDSVFSALSDGTFIVVVLDTKGCTDTVGVSITQPAGSLALVVDSTDNVACHSGTTGFISVSGSGGTSPFEFSINASPFQISGLFSGLSAGNYGIEIRDANGCTASTSISVTEPATPLGLQMSGKSDVLCFGDSSGAVSFSASGGTSPYNYSFNGGTFSSISSFSGLSAGIYSVILLDFAGCSDSLAVQIDQPLSGLSVSIDSIKQVTCKGEASGSVFGAASGGTAPYEYSLDGTSFTIGSFFTGLTAGTYILTLRDANLCIDTIGFDITEPAGILTVSAIGTDPTTCLATDGNITIAGTIGGTAPYEYSLDGVIFQTGLSFPGLGNGTYITIGRDANGCTADTTISITSTDGLLTDVSKSDVLCFGDSSGTISVNSVSGGNGVFEYSINGSAFSGTNVFNSLAAGIYTLVIRDIPLSCSTSVLVEIHQPPSPFSISVFNSSPAVCAGTPTGSVTVVASGGTAPYEYSIDGVNFQPGTSFASLVAGVYSLFGRDASGCLDSTHITITEPAPLIASLLTSTNVLCKGDSTGAFSIEGLGGQAPYTYSLDGVNFSIDATFSGLMASNYTFFVRDAASCESFDSVVISEPLLPVSLEVDLKTDVACFGEAGGSFVLSGNNGAAPYTFSLNGSVFSANNTYTDLTAGSYAITVRDDNGCQTDHVVQILEPSSSVTLSLLTSSDITCKGGDNGSITVTASGGTSPYQYAINGGPYAGLPVFTSLFAGLHVISVRDANGCEDTISVTLNEPLSPVSASILSQSEVLCFGSASGAISLQASGGQSSYEFSIDGSNFIGSGIFSNLPAGIYMMTVRDINGCSDTISTIITQPASATNFAFNSVNPVSCALNNGTITFVGTSGGTPPYVFSIDGLNYQPDSVFAGLSGGTFSLTVRDSGGCISAPASVTLTAPGGITANISTIQVSCAGNPNGSIGLSELNGGSGTYVFSIDGVNFGPDSLFSNLAAGNYSITVRDVPFGCQAVLNTTITSPDTLRILLVNQVNVQCAGASTGGFTVRPRGGTASYQISVNGGVFSSDTTYSGLSAGSYSVVLRDVNGCLDSISVNIIQIGGAIALDTASVNRVSCFGGNDGSIVAIASNGTAPYEFSINGGSFTLNNQFLGLSEGAYSIVVRDANQCQSVMNVTIGQPDSISVGIVTTDASGCGLPTGVVDAAATGGSGGYTYSLDGTNFQLSGSFTGLISGNYLLHVRDSKNCEIQRPFTINASGSFTATVFQIPVLCEGVPNGQALIANVTGGSGNYQYSLNGTAYQTSPNFSGLAFGPNTFFVRDQADTLCVANISVNIAAQFTVSGVIIIEGSGCSTNGGRIAFEVGGGTAPYQFSIDSGANFSGDSVFSGLAPGTYHLEVRDANNCSFKRSVLVPGSPVLTPYISVISQSTCGNNGIVHVDSISGSAGPFFYSIDGSNFSTSQIFTGLTPATYIVSIQDGGSGCQISDTIDISGPPALGLSAVLVNQVTCFGGNDAEVGLTAVGGWGGYEYSVDDITYQTSGNFSGLPSGTFIFFVRDSLNCIDSTVAMIGEPDSIRAEIQVLNPTGCGLNNGSLTVSNAIGGTGGYDYSIDGANFQSGPIFNSLGSGSYTLIIRDSLLCERAYPVTLTAPGAISATVSSNSTACFGDSTGSIAVTGILGGTAPFAYSLDMVNFQQDSVFQGLSSGVYTVFVVSADSCSYTASAIISQPDSLTVSLNAVKDVSCYGGNDGLIDVNVSGGTPGYRYSLDGVNYGYSDLFLNQPVGAGIVHVLDSLGCGSQVPFIISEPDSIGFELSIVNSGGCTNAAATVLVLNATGGNPPFGFSIDGGITFASIPVFFGLGNGAYTMTVRDSLGCQKIEPFSVNFSANVQALQLEVINPSCFAFSNGGIKLGFFIGGLAPYQFSIDNGATFQSDSQFTGLSSGSYPIVVKDANNCTFDTVLTLVDPPALNFSAIQQKSASCDSANGIGAIINVTGGTPPYLYQIDYQNRPPQTSPVFTGLPPGLYIVSVTDTTGICEIFKLLAITGNPGVTYDYEVRNAACFNGANGQIVLTNVFGGTLPMRIFLSDTAQDYVTIDSTRQATVGGLKAGTYAPFILDFEGCRYNLPALNVGQNSLLTFETEAVKMSRKGRSEGAILIYDVEGGTPGYRYSFDNQNFSGIPFSFVTNSYSVLADSLPIGNYTIYVEDTFGCITAKTSRVYELQFAPEFEIPNLFTPNNDGYNDTFHISRLPAGCRLVITARNGRRVFESDDYQNNWDAPNEADGYYLYSLNVPGVGEFKGFVAVSR